MENAILCVRLSLQRRFDQQASKAADSLPQPPVSAARRCLSPCLSNLPHSEVSGGICGYRESWQRGFAAFWWYSSFLFLGGTVRAKGGLS